MCLYTYIVVSFVVGLCWGVVLWIADENCMGWLWLVGSLLKHVFFAEYRLFYRALLQKRRVFLGSLLWGVVLWIVVENSMREVYTCIVVSFVMGLCWGGVLWIEVENMGWLRLVGSLKSYVSVAEYRLFYRALLQKRPMFWGSLLGVYTPYDGRYGYGCIYTHIYLYTYSVRKLPGVLYSI